MSHSAPHRRQRDDSIYSFSSDDEQQDDPSLLQPRHHHHHRQQHLQQHNPEAEARAQCLQRVVYIIDFADFMVASMSEYARLSSVCSAWRGALHDYGRREMWERLSRKFTSKMLARILLHPKQELALEFLVTFVRNAGISLTCDNTFEDQLPSMRGNNKEMPTTFLFKALWHSNPVVADGLVRLLDAKMFDCEISGVIRESPRDFVETLVPHAGRVVWHKDHPERLKEIQAAHSSAQVGSSVWGSVWTAQVVASPSLYYTMLRKSIPLARMALRWTSDECLTYCDDLTSSGNRQTAPLLILALESVRTLADVDVVEEMLMRGHLHVDIQDKITRRTAFDVATSNQICGKQMTDLLLKYKKSV